VPPLVVGRVLGYAECGYSSADIAAKLGLKARNVRKIIQKARTTGGESQRHKCGRERIFGQRYEHSIRRAVVADPFRTATDIATEMRHTIYPAPSIRTVQDILQKRLDMPARRPAKRPRLNDEQRQARLNFCLEHADWTEDQWREVLFSDESAFEQFGKRKRFVRRPIGERDGERYVIQTVKHCLSVMIWGCIGARGVGELWFFPPGEKINGSTYKMVVESCVAQSMRNVDCSTFQQDGAPCHKAEAVLNYFADNHIRLLKWPGNSADLNPIENLWDLLKDVVADMRPSSFSHLSDCIEQAWRSPETRDLCDSLITSMPRRIRAVIDAQGGNTKY
jgi:hypothetical protein